ncbi:MAG: AEC family transporter [Clostridia bacterium]|nr:AEC family transporter [Clostridia bacterium]
MQYSLILLKQVIIIFAIICVGIGCYKTKFITKEGGKYFSSLLLKIVSPAFIFSSYQTEFSKELLRGLLAAFLLSILSHILLIIISGLLIKKDEKYEYSIERFSLVYTNCGFMGIPLAQGVFGAEGVLYATAYVTVFNLLAWSHGIAIIKNEFSKKELLNVIKSPVIISIVAGVIFYILNIRLPEIIEKPIEYIGSMNTPLAMLVSGITIAQSNFLSLIKNKRVAFVTLLRLIVIPLIIIPLMSFIPVNRTAYMTVMLAVCSPAATMGILFSIEYDKNAVYASEIFAATTVISAVTMPLMLSYITLFN